MSENILPLPAKIWIEPESLRHSEERLDPGDIEYIRADVAKERERKLIASASWRNPDALEDRINDAYRHTGLEELE